MLDNNPSNFIANNPITINRINLSIMNLKHHLTKFYTTFNAIKIIISGKNNLRQIAPNDMLL
jgi:hypothetical protein